MTQSAIIQRGQGDAPAVLWPITNGHFLAILLVFGAIWLTVISSFSLTPPSDNIEQLIWLEKLSWGYYKHPPLPTWLAWFATWVLGKSPMAIAALGAACALTAFYVFWSLLNRMSDARYATVVCLAVMCVPFYSARLNYFNHNIVLLLLSTITAYCAYRAFESEKLRWWFGVALAVGLGAITKYQIVVSLVSLALLWVLQRGWQTRKHQIGLAIVVVTAVAFFLPHLNWLVNNNFAPFTYAKTTSLGAGLSGGERVIATANWLADLLLGRGFASWIFLGSLVWVSRITRAKVAIGVVQPTAKSALGFELILCWGLVPVAFIVSLGLFAGADLQMHWGTSFLNFGIAAVLSLLFRPSYFSGMTLKQIVFCFIAIQSIFILYGAVTMSGGFQKYHSARWQSFDSRAAARQVEPLAQAALGGPVMIVVGKHDIAGAIALQLPSHPKVLIENRLDFSPWVSQDLIDRCGALEVANEYTDASFKSLAPQFPSVYWRIQMPKPNQPACITVH